jgi:hypothetical protein
MATSMQREDSRWRPVQNDGRVEEKPLQISWRIIDRAENGGGARQNFAL